MSAFDQLLERLTLPVIAAPMFLVSGPELVTAACRSGVIGSFPTANTRTSAELADWLTRIAADLAEQPGANAPVAPNLIVHKSNARLAEDLSVLLKQPQDLVITSVGSPTHVIGPLHDVGTLVFADVASIRHAHKAIEAGVDGLILLTAGAGGQTGWANPFAFVRAVRQFFDGPVVLAGGVSDGISLAAARTLGADLAYMGTKFLATAESMAPQAHKEMVATASLDDIVLSDAFTGLPTNMLGPSITALGIDMDALRTGTADMNRLFEAAEGTSPWRALYSAGHSTSGVTGVPTVAELVEQTLREYDESHSRRFASKAMRSPR